MEMKYDSCGQVLIAKMNQDIKKYNKKVRITFVNDSTKITTFFTCVLTHKNNFTILHVFEPQIVINQKA